MRGCAARQSSRVPMRPVRYATSAALTWSTLFMTNGPWKTSGPSAGVPPITSTSSAPSPAFAKRMAPSSPCQRTISPVFARAVPKRPSPAIRSEEHTSELQSLAYLVCRLLLEKKKQMMRTLTMLPTLVRSCPLQHPSSYSLATNYGLHAPILTILAPIEPHPDHALSHSLRGEH